MRLPKYRTSFSLSMVASGTSSELTRNLGFGFHAGRNPKPIRFIGALLADVTGAAVLP